MTPREAATAAVFVATFLLLALGRIGRRDVPRGPAALVGGVLTAVLWRLGTEAIDWQVILLLASLMALAGLAGAAGAFRGLQSLLARLPPAWALGAAVAAMGLASAVLLNDAAVVVLVPLLLPSLQARGLRVVPSVVLLAVAANAGSILTPFGNPQNAVLARAAGLRVPDFLADQALVALVAAASLAVACWREGRRAGPATPMPSQAAPRGQWRTMAACATLLALASLTDLPLGTAAAIAALVASALLLPSLGLNAIRHAARGVDLNVLALFLGLYWLTDALPLWFPDGLVPTSRLDGPASATLVVTLLSNTVGNVPATLTLLRLDPAWVVLHAPFLVTTTTLGGALLLTGSAASLIAADQARACGVQVRFLAFLRHAWVILPALLVGAWWTW